MAESNRIFNFITPFINQVQLVENMLDDLRKKRWLASATGAQLDGYGDILDVDRAGLDDDNYRIALFRKILLNIGSGQPEVLIEYLDSILIGDFELIEIQPATVKINIYELPSPLDLLNELNKLRPVGVGFELNYIENKTLAFNFGDENGFISDGYGFYENGYPELNGYTAGKLSEKIII